MGLGLLMLLLLLLLLLEEKPKQLQILKILQRRMKILLRLHLLLLLLLLSLEVDDLLLQIRENPLQGLGIQETELLHVQVLHPQQHEPMQIFLPRRRMMMMLRVDRNFECRPDGAPDRDLLRCAGERLTEGSFESEHTVLQGCSGDTQTLR